MKSMRGPSVSPVAMALPDLRPPISPTTRRRDRTRVPRLMPAVRRIALGNEDGDSIGEDRGRVAHDRSGDGDGGRPGCAGGACLVLVCDMRWPLDDTGGAARRSHGLQVHVSFVSDKS